MPWAFQLRPDSRELLSGYLARTAHAHGSVAGAFCRRHLGDSWYFTRDVDRGVVASRHELLAQLAGCSTPDIRELTLLGEISALTPSTYRQNASAAVVPWVTAVGVDQARRRYRALAFCSECLNERGVVQKNWRLVFHTWCPVHGRPLMDACLRCSAPFVPHLARGSLASCHQCGTRLWGPAQGREDSSVGAAAELQACMDRLLGRATAWDQEARDRLCGYRVLASVGLFGHAARAAAAQARGGPVDALDDRLEFLPLAQRVQAMGWLARVVEGWPQSFRDLAEGGLTQRSFARMPDSAWLQAEVDRLPLGFSRRRGRGVTQLALMLRAPKGRPSSNWRARRAQVLMRKAMAHGH